VIYITSKSYLKKASKVPLEGSKIRYEAKKAKHPDLGPCFKPFVVESTGGWHQYSFDYLKTIALHLGSRLNRPMENCFNTILKVCSFALKRHQGAMLARRCFGMF
jgi:hypothetical protein